MAPSRCRRASQKFHGCYCVRAGVNFLNAGAEFLGDLPLSPGWKAAQRHLSLSPATSHAEWELEGRAQGSAHSWRCPLLLQRPQRQSGRQRQARMARGRVLIRPLCPGAPVKALAGPKRPHADFSGDTTLAFSVQFVQDPGLLFRDFLTK